MKRTPEATYRLQFNHQFTFQQALGLVEYLQELGISHCYASPLFKAKPGSLHGYDVIDYNQLNPEIGTQEEFYAFTDALRERNMGLVIDIVPNHMNISDSENHWWQDVLKNGPSSAYAAYFDINWHSSPDLGNKILLPVLKRDYWETLKNHDLKVIYDQEAFFVQLSDMKLPTDPLTWKLILNSHEYLNTLNSNEKLLDAFLNAQHYRLCEWKKGNEQINYRRFFDILDLVGINIEKPEVFRAVHASIFDWIQKDAVQGLRIDHVDGLRNPEEYLHQLKLHCPHILYTIVEKILIGNEKLRRQWPIQGTVGYDFLTQLNGLFVRQPNKQTIEEIYCSFTGAAKNVFQHIYESKKLILRMSLISELDALAQNLFKIAEQEDPSNHFTKDKLREGICEIIACFPVYRSYICNEGSERKEIDEEDRQIILSTISKAKKLHSPIKGSIYDFIKKILLQEYPFDLSEEQKCERQNFILQFEQLTAAVMGKGLEDTAFYRFYPLVSLNEVGGNLYDFGIDLESFHKKNLERCNFWPHTMLSTSTHDTKHSEDVRARINVLSEIPDQWHQALQRWSEENRQYKIRLNSCFAPDKNEEYFFYQNLIGTWPLEPLPPLQYLEYVHRIQNYMEKSIKEAKIHTNWIVPNKQYDEAIHQFVEQVLGSGPNQNAFLRDFSTFIPKIMAAGMLNSLSQLLIKFTSPGIPDIYQGNEIWDFSLVDPDNRRPVDFLYRQTLLKKMREESAKKSSLDFIESLLQWPEDGKLKLFITKKTLQIRKKLEHLFKLGEYLPLNTQGPKQEHVIAFARIFENKAVIVISTRFFTSLLLDSSLMTPPTLWKNTKVLLSASLRGKTFKNAFTDTLIAPEVSIDLEKELYPFPFALLYTDYCLG